MIIRIIGQDGYPTDIHSQNELSSILESIIVEHGECAFYFSFLDTYSKLCNQLIKELQQSYPQVKRVFVVPYKDVVLPHGYDDFDELIVPIPCSAAKKQNSINLRNKWLGEHSDATLMFSCWEDEQVVYIHRFIKDGVVVDLA